MEQSETLADPRPLTQNRVGLNAQWKASQDSRIEMVLYYNAKHHVRQELERVDKEVERLKIYPDYQDHVAYLLQLSSLIQNQVIPQSIFDYMDREEKDCKAWKAEQDALIFEKFGNYWGGGVCKICLEPVTRGETNPLD